MVVVQRAIALADRIKTVALSQPDAGAWFAMWRPVGGAFIRLAKTIARLLMHLKGLASATTVEPADVDLRAELAEELRDIADEFPDVADVLFGMSNLDAVYSALMNDADSRAAASDLSTAIFAILDRFIAGLVDIVMGYRESPISAERVVELLGRYEDIAQGLIDRWITPPE